LIEIIINKSIKLHIIDDCTSFVIVDNSLIFEMTLNVLKLLFTVGGFLAITPRNTKIDIKLYHKLYALLLITSIGFAMMLSLIYKNFYINFFHMKIVVAYLSDINIYVFNCTAVINATFCKSEKWSKLVDNLKTERNNLKSSKLPLVWFIITHVFVSVLLLITSSL
jgi:hypothetical protein